MLPKELLIIISSYIEFDVNDAIDIIQDAHRIQFNENDYKTILKLGYPDLYDEFIELIKECEITYNILIHVLYKTKVYVDKTKLLKNVVNNNLNNKGIIHYILKEFKPKILIYNNNIDIFNFCYPILRNSVNAWSNLYDYITNQDNSTSIMDLLEEMPINSIIPFLEWLYKQDLYRNYESKYYVDLLQLNLGKKIENYDTNIQFSMISDDVDTYYEGNNDIEHFKELNNKYQKIVDRTFNNLDEIIHKYVKYIKLSNKKNEFIDKAILYLKFVYNNFGNQGITHIIIHHIDLLKWYVNYPDPNNLSYSNTRGQIDLDMNILESIVEDFNSNYLSQYEDLLNYIVNNDKDFLLCMGDTLNKINKLKLDKIKEEHEYNKKYKTIIGYVDTKFNKVLKKYGKYPETFRILINNSMIILIPNMKSKLIQELKKEKESTSK
jgi:hypothetical protein